MITISICMIVRNEENIISNCLESVKNLAEEIIIVDTGSTDRTKQVAKNYTDKIYNFIWVDDFSAARNFAFSLATQDYIMWLDADDLFLKEDAANLKILKEVLDPSIDSVTMKYNVGFDKFGNVTTSYRRNRLVKRTNHFKWMGFVHEYIEVYGKIINSEISVTHKKTKSTPRRNIEIYQEKLKQGVVFTARDTLYYGNELYDHKMYDEALLHYTKFLNSKQGWLEDNIRVCQNICDYYQLISQEEEARKYAFKTFEYDTPRAEACCRLGASFLHENKLTQATYWYETATKLEKPKDSWGFFNDECWTWLPHLQLSVCYDKLGNYELAYKHNEIAGSYRPADERIVYNKNYFKGLGFE